MAVSGTTAFNLDFAELAEEAFERAGKEMRTGYDLRTATRSMNLMTIEFQNRGINMWTIDEGEIDLIEGVAEYDLPADTIDLMDHVVRTGGLAYYIAMKFPDLAPRMQMLKQEYEFQFDLAAQEDREKASVRFVPRIIGIRS